MEADAAGWERVGLRTMCEMLLPMEPVPEPLAAVALDAAEARALVAARPFLVKFHAGTALAMIATAGMCCACMCLTHWQPLPSTQQKHVC